MRIGRRAFLLNGSLILSTGAAMPSLWAEGENSGVLRIGMVTDLHYADKPPRGSRHYRETPRKLAAAANQLQQRRPDFIVELGDLVDAAESVDVELDYLKRINEQFSAICPSRHYVLGNHCVHTLTKEEFLGAVGKPESYYSFDAGEFHFVVLDSCFRSDGQPYGRKNFDWTDANVPEAELSWLRHDLEESTRQTIVFAHQRLDVSNHYGVANAAAVRTVLESSGKVLAVLQGHSHQNDHHEIKGIHYGTLVAMVEGSGASNNAFSLMQIAHDGTIQIDGFLKQDNHRWSV